MGSAQTGWHKHVLAQGCAEELGCTRAHKWMFFGRCWHVRVQRDGLHTSVNCLPQMRACDVVCAHGCAKGQGGAHMCRDRMVKLGARRWGMQGWGCTLFCEHKGVQMCGAAHVVTQKWMFVGRHTRMCKVMGLHIRGCVQEWGGTPMSEKLPHCGPP